MLPLKEIEDGEKLKRLIELLPDLEKLLIEKKYKQKSSTSTVIPPAKKKESTFIRVFKK